MKATTPADPAPTTTPALRLLKLEPPPTFEFVHEGPPRAVYEGRALAIDPPWLVVETEPALPDATGGLVTLRSGEARLEAAARTRGPAPQGRGALLELVDLGPAQQAQLEALITRFRKADHIRICRDEDVRSENVTTGFERWRLPHDALPELDKREIELRTELFGRPLAAPLLISCMTGGSELARRINERLARAAQRFGIALGLGSGRALLVDPSLRDTFAVRPLCPDVPLFANLGAVQLNYGVGLDDCRRLVELLEADALVLHLNPLQEAVQPEGDVDFRGLRDKIARLAEALEVPVILKEVGSGLGAGLARWAASTAIAGLDTAGTGGTSWARVESYRAGDSVLERLGRSFSGWGVPTAQSVLACRAALPDRLVIASGGIRNGIEAAKAIALGADLVGIARPFLQAASESEPVLADEITLVIEQLRVAMFCSGCRDLAALRRLDLEPVADRGDATTETGRSYR